MKNSRFNLLSLLISFTFLFFSINVFSQQIVSGSVSDDAGNPLPGVSIVEKNTTNGVVSDFDGNFQLSVGDNAVLVFSYLGYLTQEVSSLSTSMSVTLQEDVSKLEEVVVVGYGSQTKKTLTGAVGTVDSEALTLKPAQNTSELMMGQVAGLSTIDVPRARVAIYLYKVSISFKQSNGVLFVVSIFTSSPLISNSSLK